MTIDATFDEFNLDLAIHYQGRLPEKAESGFGAPQLLQGQGSVAHLASVLLHRLADRVKMKASGSNCELDLQFEH